VAGVIGVAEYALSINGDEMKISMKCNKWRMCIILALPALERNADRTYRGDGWRIGAAIWTK